MVRRGWTGAWMLVGALWLTQYGAVNAQEDAPRLAAGPSQGAIPPASQSPAANQQADTAQGGGGGGGGPIGRLDADDADDQVDLDQRGDGGTRRADREDSSLMEGHPLDSGGGGGMGLPRNVTPLMQGNPDGVDAVPDAPSRGGGGGGGGNGNSGIWVTPFYMVVPDQEATPNYIVQ